MSFKGKSIQHFVHRLVGRQFLDGDQNLDINHKDANPLNNFYKNLEFGTEQYNMLYAVYVSETKGIINADIAHKARKMFLEGKTMQYIADYFGVNKDIFSNVFNGRSWYLLEDKEILEKCKDKYCTGRSIKQPVLAISIIDGSEESFPSLNDAAQTLGLAVASIWEHINKGNRKRVGNFKFKLIC